MPGQKDNPKPQQPSRVGPFEYLKQLFAGGQLPEMYANEWPELAQQFASTSIEMPEESAKVRRVRPMSLLERAFYPDAYAKTSPFGNIMLNRELIEAEGQDLGNTLVHEMTHIGQGKGGFLKKYVTGGGDALENEAINREAMRKRRNTDIQLFPPRK